jgi:hypothetical protein
MQPNFLTDKNYEKGYFMKDLELALKFIVNNSALTAAYRGAMTQTRRFVDDAQREFQSLRRFWDSTAGKLGMIGIGLGAVQLVRDAAAIEKKLNTIRIASGGTREEIAALDERLKTMSLKTGKDMDDLADTFLQLYKNLPAKSAWEASAAGTEAINSAMVVTGSSADVLATGLLAAQRAWDLDLSKPKEAMSIFDKMAVAGKGVGGMGVIAEIFSSLAGSAQQAGMSLNSTISLVGMLSSIEKDPGKLNAMAEGVLRLFNNTRLLKNIKGVRIFDESGARRDPIAVLNDIRAKYDSLTSDKDKAKLMNQMFGGMDQRAMRGIQRLLQRDALDFGDQLQAKMKDAAGEIENKVPDAMKTTVDQANRLKSILKEAGEGFAKPVNKKAADIIQKLIDSRDKGGMGLSGNQLISGGIAALIAMYAGGRLLKGTVGKWLSGGAGTVAGIAEGRAIEATTGVPSVFVVNWPAGFGVSGTPGVPGAPGNSIPGTGIPLALKAPLAFSGAALAATIFASLSGLVPALGFNIGREYAERMEKIKTVNKNAYPTFNPALADFLRAHPERVFGLPDPNKETPLQNYLNKDPNFLNQKPPTVNVYIDGEKKKPSKTIVDNRGSLD